ncbi:MAG TPA: pantoate--beta-alanine ligase [Planctomycetaceae bacterium]|nr:pantoate--beta-alanine ligase [Planctomycetaceae bacterium]
MTNLSLSMTDHPRQLVVTEQIAEMLGIVRRARDEGSRVGLVPTMGALHAGHLSLMHAARRECDFVVASIFVNPAQFGPKEDFARYPRNLDVDLALCAQAGVDAVFHPAVETMYAAGFATYVDVAGMSDVLEGKFRPGHFRGVTTVVLKLFQIIPADVAFFGQKDFQQQAIIRRMSADLDLPIEIRVCPTVREADGLALSSRNVYLSADDRRSALAVSKSLQLARELIAGGRRDLPEVRQEMLKILSQTARVSVEYATLIHPETLEEVSEVLPKLVAVVAARVGTTRLIDNLVIETGI